MKEISTKETELLKKAGFEKEGEEWVKFEGSHEYYIKIENEKILHQYYYNPVDEEGESDEDECFDRSNSFSSLTINWFDDAKEDF
jgi:hypothetical protein